MDVVMLFVGQRRQVHPIDEFFPIDHFATPYVIRAAYHP